MPTFFSVVLIVDDHIDTCRALVLLLEDAGIPAACVEDPTKAIESARATQARLIVLDQMMPHMRGTELLSTMRTLPELAHVPVIFYSATSDGQDEASRLDALAWLIKGRTGWTQLRHRIIEEYRARSPVQDV